MTLTLAKFNQDHVVGVLDHTARVFSLADYPYSAVFDNGGTDNSAALLACHSDAIANGGGTIHVPGGRGIIKADPPGATLGANIRIKGDGAGITILQAASTGGRFLVSNSNVTLEDFTFIGKANNGAATTNQAVYVLPTTADVTDIAVRRCNFSQFKSTEVIRGTGSGDENTAATYFARRITVERCRIENYYDIDNTNLGQACYGIFFGYGCTDVMSERNYVDGAWGKHGVGAIGQCDRFTSFRDTVLNCGTLNGGSYFGYGILAYSGTIPACAMTDVHVIGAKVRNNSRAGIYFQSVNGGSITGFNLRDCDIHTSGLGTVGSGAIMVNNNGTAGDVRQGPVSISGGTIIDPGLCAIYVNQSSAKLSTVTVSGVTARVTTAVSRVGVVMFGRNAVIGDDCSFRGFTNGVMLYTGVADDCGDLTIGGEYDATGAAGTPVCITRNNNVQMGALKISARFLGYNTAINLPTVTDLTIAACTFSSCTTMMSFTATRATVTGCVADSGTNGIIAICTPATASARIIITGNVMSCTVPYSGTENTGKIIVPPGSNNFGHIGGYGGNNGDVSGTVTPPTQDVYCWNSTLTANRTVTLSGAGAVKGCSKVRILRNAAAPGAFTLAVVDGVGSGTLYTIAASTKGWVDAEFDGTNWQFTGYATIP